MSAEAWAAVSALAAVGGIGVALYVARVNARQGHVIEEMVRSFATISQSYERDLRELRADVDKLKGGAPSSGIEARKLALREREAEWKKTKDIMRGVGWFLKNVEVE